MSDTNKKIFNLSLQKFLFLISILFIELYAKKSLKDKKKPIPFKSKVIELNDTTFENFNKTNKAFFVYFTGDKCKKCLKINPNYEQSSDFASRSEWKIPYVRINLSKNPKLKAAYKIKKAPKIFFANYEDGEFHKFFGKKSPKYFMKFINHHLNYTTEEVHKFEDITSKKKNGNYLIFIGDPQKHIGIYRRIIKASKEEDIEFLWSKSDALFEKFEIPKDSFDAVLMQKKSQKKGFEIRGNLRITDITSIKDLESYMEVFERRVWGRSDDWYMLNSVEAKAPTPSAYLIYNKKNKEQKQFHLELSSMMEKVAKKHRREYHFMNVTVNSHLATPLLKVFNLTKDKSPYLVLLDNNKDNKDDVDKYLFPRDQMISEENVEKFVKDFQEKKLEKVVYSELVKENAEFIPGVKYLVAKNYDNFLFRETVGKDVLFILHSDLSYSNDSITNRIKNTYEKLSGNSHLAFALSNPLLNEMTNFSTENLPALFYIKGNTESERRQSVKEFYMKIYNTKNFVEFVKESSSSPITEKKIENEEKIFVAELKDDFQNGKKDEEEELIDYENNHAGLRRYTKFTMEEDDKDDDIEEDGIPEGLEPNLDGEDEPIIDDENEPEEDEVKDDL